MKIAHSFAYSFIIMVCKSLINSIILVASTTDVRQRPKVLYVYIYFRAGETSRAKQTFDVRLIASPAGARGSLCVFFFLSNEIIIAH